MLHKKMSYNRRDFFPTRQIIFFVTSIQFIACALWENLSNRSSGVQILRDICIHFGRCLYSMKCSWIIILLILLTLIWPVLITLCCDFSRESKVTLLLKDALGGNCRTKALVTLHPSDSSSLATVLKTAGQLAQVQNYPVVNDFMAKVCS